MALNTPQYAANIFIRSVLRDLGLAFGGFSDEHWEEALEFFDHRCAYTGVALDDEDLQREHAVPANKDHGGLDLRGNVVPATASANQRKGGQHFATFLRDDPERLAKIEEFQRTTGYADVAKRVGDLPEFLRHHYRVVVGLHATATETLRARVPESTTPDAPTSPTSVPRGLARDNDGPLEIVLVPEDPDEFRTQLLQSRRATLEEHYDNGTVRTKTWKARNFASDSEVIPNIRSRPAYRSGPRQASGLVKVVATVARPEGA